MIDDTEKDMHRLLEIRNLIKNGCELTENDSAILKKYRLNQNAEQIKWFINSQYGCM